MSKVSVELEKKFGKAGQELNAVAAAIAPITKQIAVDGITEAVNKAVASHAPQAAPFADSLLAGFLHWLRLE